MTVKARAIWEEPDSPHPLFRASPLIQNHVLPNDMLESDQERWEIMAIKIYMHLFIFRINTHSLNFMFCSWKNRWRKKCHPVRSPKARPQTRPGLWIPYSIPFPLRPTQSTPATGPQNLQGSVQMTRVQRATVTQKRVLMTCSTLRL